MRANAWSPGPREVALRGLVERSDHRARRLSRNCRLEGWASLKDVVGRLIADEDDD